MGPVGPVGPVGPTQQQQHDVGFPHWGQHRCLLLQELKFMCMYSF